MGMVSNFKLSVEANISFKNSAKTYLNKKFNEEVCRDLIWIEKTGRNPMKKKDLIFYDLVVI